MAPFRSVSILLVSLASGVGFASDSAMPVSQCGLHHVQLVQVEVPILYGKPLISEVYSQAKESQFPNARERCVFGGCDPQATKKAKVMVCPKCSESRKRWLSEHQVKDARI